MIAASLREVTNNDRENLNTSKGCLGGAMINLYPPIS